MNNDICRWSTPLDIFEPLDEEFGFTLDVCAEPWNAKCKRFFNPEQDGLKQSWAAEVCWMNPPYGREIDAWMRKANREALLGATVVCLVPARTDTHWFHDVCLQPGAQVRFVCGRIHFIDCRGRSGRPRFGSAIVVLKDIESAL